MDAEKNMEEESKILGEEDAGDEDEAEDDEAEDGGEKESAMERYCGVGRVWIFLALGVVTLVLSAVLAGVHMNVRVITSSLEVVEVVPSFLPAATGGLAGVLVLLLFWRRYKILVYGAVTLCVASAILCVVASVLTGTHVLQPLLSVSGCVYRRLEKACRCTTQFRRIGMGLEEVQRGDHAFLMMEGTLSCDDVYTVLPGLMYAMVGVYGVLALVCLVAGVIALLVYRTELRKKYVQNLVYDDQFSCPSGQPFSDSHAENHAMLPLQPSLQTNDLMLLNTYINPSNTTNDEDNSTNNDGNTTPSDLVYSPADVPMGYAEACRMRRCQSFNQPRRGSLREGSPGSSASSQANSLPGGDKNIVRAMEGPSKLKAHRKKGRRAVTLHGLDREQLLLILSLQMRYLQESDQSAKRETTIKDTGNNFSNSKQDGAVSGDSSQDSADSSLLFAQLQRRALTPTPRQERLSRNRSADDDLDYRPAKLVRSHTPQPHHLKTTNPNQYKQNQPPHQLYPQHYHPQQPPPDDDEQPTLITFDLRNIKMGPVVYGHTSSAQSSVSGCGPDSSCSSNNSSLTCSSAGLSQSKLTPGTCHPLVYLSAQPTHQGNAKVVNVEDVRHPNSQLRYHTSQMSTSSQSDRDNFPSDTWKLISSKENLTSEQEAANNRPRKFSKNEDVMMKESDHPAAVPRSTELRRTDSGSNRICAGADRWRALMEDGSQQSQTLWENVQRRPPSDPQPPDYNVDSLVLSRRQLEASVPDTGCCQQPYLIKAQLKHVSSPVVSSSDLAQPDPCPQATLTGQLDSLNVVFNNLPETRFVSAHLPVSSNPHHNLHHKTQTKSPKSERHPPPQNSFIPIDSSFTDNSEDTDQTDCQPQHLVSAPTNQVTLNKVPVNSMCDGQQMDKLDHSPNSTRPNFDRLQSRSKNYAFDTEVTTATHFNDPLSNSSQTLSQWLETGQSTITDREVEKSHRDADRRQVLDRPIENDRRHASDRTIDDRRKVLERSVEEDRKHVLDRHLQDDRRRFLDRPVDNRRRGSDISFEDDIYYQTTNADVYTQACRQPYPTTKPMSDCSSSSKPTSDRSRSRPDRNLPQVYHNPYAIQASSGQSKTNRHVYNSSAHRPQHSAFYTLGHGPKTGSTFHHSHGVQEGPCDTDLDSLPAPQGQYIRGQSLPPPALYHSLESVARPIPSRSGFATSSETRGTLYTSSELSVTPSCGGHQDSRSGGNSWNKNPSRYPSYQSGLSTDHRYYTQQHPHHQNLQWQQLASRGLSREQLYMDNQTHTSSHRQPHINIRRCQSVDEGNRSTRPHLYPGSYRAGHHGGPGSFYQNIGALRAENSGLRADKSVLRAEMKNGASTNSGTHVRQPLYQSYSTCGGHGDSMPALFSKKVTAEDIAGYVGVIRMVESSDSDSFAETVI